MKSIPAPRNATKGMEMGLKEQGFRYMVHREKDRYGWVHPAEIVERKSEGWVDCTDMPDDELVEFFKPVQRA